MDFEILGIQDEIHSGDIFEIPPGQFIARGPILLDGELKITGSLILD